MSASAKELNHIVTLIAIRRWVEIHQTWVVIIYKDNNLLNLLNLMAGVLPASAKNSGRTSMLINGSKVSIVASSSEVFVPTDQSFVLYTIGSKLPGEGHWGSRATRLLNRELHV